MARPSSKSLPILVYVLVMAAGGVAAKVWHEGRMEKVIFTAPFRITSPPTGTAPGSRVNVRYQTFNLGNHLVCEIGNLRIATATKDRNHYYGQNSGSHNFVVPDPEKEHQSNRSSASIEFANGVLQVVNGEVQFGDRSLSVLGPKQLVLIDRNLTIVSETLLEDQ